MITTLAISGYRSLRDLVVPLGQLTVVTGANGSGKSSLYRALRLLADAAQGRVVASLAAEGGLGSVLWAGPESLGGARAEYAVQGTMRKGPVSLRLGFASDAFGYLIDLGLPQQTGESRGFFLRDPEIKREAVFAEEQMRPASTLVQRRRGVVQVRDPDGRWEELPLGAGGGLGPDRSVLGELADPVRTPEVLALREQVRRWRFYDGFRTDPLAPARRPQVGTRTPVLADDGSDLAAALATILEWGPRDLVATLDDAFGARLDIDVHGGMFDLALHQPGMLRPLRAAELSDGTLRYLLLAAALLTPSPPPLMVLNEPETSLHPSLVEPLARLVLRAARHTQTIVVTHSAALVAALEEGQDASADDGELPEVATLELVKDLGETRVPGLGLLTTPPWSWGRR